MPATSFPATCFTVNNRAVSVTADGDTPLLDILRNHLGLVGTKFGCGAEQCGSCMVLIDGKPEKSCGKALSTVAGKAVVTIEGLGTPRPPAPAAAGVSRRAGRPVRLLPRRHPDLGEGAARRATRRRPRAEIARALDDNICRCGSHVRILRAVERAAAADASAGMDRAER